MKKIISVIIAALVMLSLCAPAFAIEYAVDARVKEYLVAPSQYTNNGQFGKFIETTLTQNGNTTSLGNYGGYVVYEFNTPVMNDPKNPYGVDFRISGNAFNGALTTQEPGQVWVSQDGENWYALAGSEHFENQTDWNYSVTYKNNGTNICDYVDSNGESGAVSGRIAARYPDKDFYTTVEIPDDEITLGGVCLAVQRTPSMKNGIQTQFGYVDAYPYKIDNIAYNPYIENPTDEGIDGQFDISWAVDENGYPVRLDYVNFVKVQTATFIDGAMFGEKSTEVSRVCMIETGEKVSFTKSAESITVNGQEIEITDGKIGYDISELCGGEITVSVNADENSSVYINNLRSSERTFESAPDKGIIRVIVQDGEKNPQIIYLYTDPDSQAPETETLIGNQIFDRTETPEEEEPAPDPTPEKEGFFKRVFRAIGDFFVRIYKWFGKTFFC